MKNHADFFGLITSFGMSGFKFSSADITTRYRGGHGWAGCPKKNGWRPYMAILDILGQSQLIGGVPFWKFSAGPQPPVVGRCGAPTSSLTLEVSRAGHQWKWYRLFGVHFSNSCWTLYLERCWFKQGNPVFCVFVEPWHVWWILFALRCDAGCHPQNLGEELLIFSVSWLHLRLADQPAKKTRPDSDKASGPAPKWQRSSCVFKTLLYVMLCYKAQNT